jgi:hypothetical protein
LGWLKNIDFDVFWKLWMMASLENNVNESKKFVP